MKKLMPVKEALAIMALKGGQQVGLCS